MICQGVGGCKKDRASVTGEAEAYGPGLEAKLVTEKDFVDDESWERVDVLCRIGVFGGCEGRGCGCLNGSGGWME